MQDGEAEMLFGRRLDLGSGFYLEVSAFSTDEIEISIQTDGLVTEWLTIQSEDLSELIDALLEAQDFVEMSYLEEEEEAD